MAIGPSFLGIALIDACCLGVNINSTTFYSSKFASLDDKLDSPPRPVDMKEVQQLFCQNEESRKRTKVMLEAFKEETQRIEPERP